MDRSAEGLRVSILKGMRADVLADLAKPVWLVHPTKSEFRVAFRRPTDYSEVAKLRRKAQAQKDEGNFEAALVAACCEQIKKYDLVAIDDDGNFLTFRDKEIQDDLGALSAKEAVRAFYGSDGYVNQVALQLLAEAGWGSDDVVPEEDPT